MKMIVNTRTQDDYIEVVKWALSQNIAWFNGDTSVHENYWNCYGDRMCVVITDNKKIAHSSTDELIENCSNFLSIDQFYKKVGINSHRKFGNKYDLK